ncbi:unnamed protein product [Notodromas monacha]|uniref:Rab3 GTPase-activating protein non-catalytic subunit n=1 Tax=Notodromas monacha TaxID=399045 RepID=A0A7R9BKW6_9CRUS|nr:unnamed protein product [Notodromas monacha]CAG0917366.1 unnamed protein product [Notodromas monacha]
MACNLTAVRHVRALDETFEFLIGPSAFAETLQVNASKSRFSDDYDDVPVDTYIQWPNGVLASVSPYGDYAAFAAKRKIVIHASCQSKSQGSYPLDPIYRNDYFEANVSAVLCVPVASHRKSSLGRPDWTCLFLGFSNGDFKIIIDDGTVLLSERFHEEEIINIKCRSYKQARFSGDHSGPVADEVVVLYPSAVVFIESFNLFHNIQSARSGLALHKANANKSEPWVNERPVDFKKYSVDPQAQLRDCDGPVGATQSNLFDQLKTASLIGGFGASVSLKSPVMTSFVGVGVKPFAGMYYAVESQLQLMDAARAVASKLKSALFSMSGFGESHSTEKASKKPGDSLPLRFGIPDKNREGLKVTLNPRKTHAAIVDNHGRITVIDARSGLAVRMWKGYRDAEIAWTESHSSSTHRYACFLAIYAPRRGILEVWATQHGPRVAAFNVPKAARLFDCSGLRMLGLNEAGSAHSRDSPLQILFLTGEGHLHSLVVPLYLIDCEKNKKKAEDLSVLSKIRRLMGVSSKKMKRSGDIMEILALLGTISTEELLETGLTYVMGTHSEEAMKRSQALWTNAPEHAYEEFAKILDAVIEMGELKSKEQMNPEAQSLLAVCKKYSCVTKLFSSVKIPKRLELCDNQEWRETLGLNQDEAEFIRKLISWCRKEVKVPGKNVTFSEDVEEKPLISLPQFSRHFSLTNDDLEIQNVDDATKSLPFGDTLFQGCVDRFNENTSWHCLSLVNFLPFAASHLLASDFLTDEETVSVNLQKFSRLLENLISSISDKEAIEVLRKVHASILKSSTPVAPYLLALLCRKLLAVRPKKSSKSDGDMEEIDLGTETEDNSWEDVTEEEIGWTLMCGQLANLSAVAVLVKGSNVEKFVTLEKFLSGSEASVCEIISRWSISLKLSVGKMREIGLIPELDEAEAPAATEEGLHAIFFEVRERFGQILDSDLILMNCGYEWVLRWSETANSEFLSRSLTCFEAMQNSVLCTRIQTFVWSLFVCQVFTGVASLLERTGCRMPRDRVLKREISMETSEIDEFLENVRKFLYLLLTRISTNEERLADNEERWRNSGNLGKLVMSEPPADTAVVNQHFLLCFILESALKFGIKGLKPLSLFSQTAKKSMFAALTTPLVITFMEESDTVLAKARKDFLKRLIQEAIRTLSDVVPGSNFSRLESEYNENIELWIHLSLETVVMNDGWGDADDLKQFLVSELYSRGYDVIGEKVSVGVVSKNVLAVALLSIAGKRVKAMAKSAEVNAELTPALSRWIKGLAEPDEWFSGGANIEATEKIVRSVLGWLGEKGGRDAETAAALLSSLRAIRELKPSTE